ncbi:MAG TPA: tripartite tricarboxylate transporter TctB family protein, partial [Methylomirabilota bacterium]|nr:tripartite tricarboxylate transporter TctB family protein [Methylomirabilota bacterium]
VMLTTDRVAGSALVLFALAVLVESRKLPLGTLRNPGPAYMPVLLALILVSSGICLCVGGGGAARLGAVGWSEWRHAVAILGVCAFAALALERLGYRPTVAVTLAFLVGVVERKGLLLTVVFSLALAAGTFFLFDTLLRVQLPRGPFGL